MAIVRYFGKQMNWRCSTCFWRLRLPDGDPRIGSGTAPTCTQCGAFMAPINPDRDPE